MKEQKIENDLINKLSDLKYTYRADIKDRATLEKNFREKFESLNQVKLTDKEFERLCEEIITPDTFNAAKILRGINTFKREDETPLNYTLVNIKDWCKNTFEVINQLRMNTDYSHHIYDVVLLINGIPVVQIELKTLGINPRRAMQQIVEYKNDAGNGYNKTLMCFLQLFVVSNQTNTWYFANNNSRHFAFDADERFLPLYQYADKNNRPINHLDEFAETFLAKCTLGQMISRYMVLVASEKKLLMMRPYQIYAVKAIVDCIKQGTGNGYIWHTTGSGKTLTSFKASTLLKDNPDIEKCLFVVDRKDLDRQTREEFNRFQEGCVEENTNTATLVKRLASTDYADKVIVTTIQKLGLALDENSKKNYKSQLQPLKNKRIVFIFDECHRSQFGDNHQAIKEFFPKAQLFGFTGTPIFKDNSPYSKIEGETTKEQNGDIVTKAVKHIVETKDVFQQCLHAYTITHAIEDRNVLRFHVDYYKPEGKHAPKHGEFLAKQAIVEAILEKHDTATAGRKFNALFATARIDDAIEYYQLLKEAQAKKQAVNPDYKPLHIACVFTPPVLPSNNEQENKNNETIKQLQEDLEQEREDNKKNPEEKKKALTSMLADYNVQYGTNHSVNEFDLYYQDVQKRIKDQQYPNHDYPHNQKLDIVIVVEMLLTGFDSKFLNTLYVDKNMTYHKLIQAFSRTNRVLNDTKPYGNILDFRQQQGEVDKAIALFSGKEQEAQAREIWLVDPAPKVVEKLDDAIKRLDDFMQSQGLNSRPEDVPNLKGDAARATFIGFFKEVQRLKTQLDQYTDLTPELKETIETLLPKDQLQGFKGVYLETAQRLREKQHKYDESVIPEVNELDFEFVLFASEVIDYDYIMKLIARYSQETPSKQSMSRKELIGLIQADAKFLDEREEIEAYINSLQEGVGLNEKAIKEGYERFKAEKYNRAFNAIAANYSLDATALTAFVEEILRLKRFDDEALTNLLKPLGLGWKERTAKKLALMEELIPLLHKQAKGRSIAGLDVYEQ